MRREDLAVHVRREAVFEESFRELHRRSAEEWKNRFYIVFEGKDLVFSCFFRYFYGPGNLLNNVLQKVCLCVTLKSQEIYCLLIIKSAEY